MFTDINYLTNIWWQWMAAMFWQASLFILIISSIDMLIRRWAWPQVRYALWLLILIKLLVPPTWSLSSSIVSNLNPISNESIVFIDQKPAILKQQETSNSNAPIETPKTDSVVYPKSQEEKKAGISQPWKIYAFMIWIAGMLVFFSLLILKMLKLRKWHQQYKENEKIPVWFNKLLVDTCNRIGLMRLPAIVFSDKAVTPAVYGLLRPVLLLPANYLDSLSRKEAEHILIHELSHLKRGDLWLHGLCLAMQIIYWFNPLLIWVRREMKHVREICCDLTVASVLGEKTKLYRQTLLNTARKLLTETVEPGMGLLGVFEEPFRLVSRLKWLEKKKWLSRKWIILNSGMASLFVVFAFMPMAGMEQTSGESFNEDVSKKAEATNANPKSIHFKDSLENENFFDKLFNMFKPEKKPIFTVKQTDAFWVIILPVTGTTDQQPIVFEKLRNYLKVNGIEFFGSPITRKYDDETIVGKLNLRWEAAYRIKDSIAVKEPFEVIRVPKRDLVEVHIGTSFDSRTWNIQITSWLYHNNYRVVPPHHLIWTKGIRQSGKETLPLLLQMEVRKFEEPIPQIDVYTRSMRGRYELILDMRGGHDQENDAFLKLMKYVENQNLEILSQPFVRYFNTPEFTAVEDLTWHVGIEIEYLRKVDEPFRIEWSEGCELACAKFEGNHSEIPLNFWHGFVLTFSMNGFRADGVPMKLMHKKLKDDQYAVELQWPISRW